MLENQTFFCDIHNWYTFYSLGKQVETGKFPGKIKRM